MELSRTMEGLESANLADIFIVDYVKVFKQK